MKNQAPALLALAALSMPLAAAAQTAATPGAPIQASGPVEVTTGADLARVCDPAQGHGYDYQRGICDGFIGGSGSLYVRLNERRVVTNWACGPAGASLDDARLAYLAWARSNPQYLTETATDAFWRSMNATWPCPATPG